MTLPPPPPPPPAPHDPHMMEANGRYGGKPEAPSFIVLLNVINTVTQLLIGAVVFSAFSFANVIEVSSLSQHIKLCVSGYALLMGQAILSFNSHAGWAYSLKYPQKIIIHGFMQVFGSILAITGGIIRMVDMDEHFNTAHGIAGLVAMIFTGMSLLGGVLNFIIPNLTSAGLYKTCHSCFGSLTISVAFVSLCLAMNEWYRPVFGEVNTNLAISLTVFALAGVLISASSRIIKRFVNGE